MTIIIKKNRTKHNGNLIIEKGDYEQEWRKKQIKKDSNMNW